MRLTSHDLWAHYPCITNTVHTPPYPSGGQISVPDDPDPTAEGVVLVDESSTAFAEDPPGCWTQSTGGYQDSLRHTATFTTTAAPGYSACAGTWSLPQLPGRAGEFEVYAYVPSTHATADGAIYEIHHQGRTHQAVVAQAEFLQGGNHWAYLGKYTFDLDGAEFIRLANVTDDEVDGLELAADAVMLVPVAFTPVPPAEVAIDGPVTGIVDTAYTFTATVSPDTATQPITYTWQATGQSPAAHMAGLSDTVTLTWEVTGTQLITVTAANAAGAVSDTHAITIVPRSLNFTLNGGLAAAGVGLRGAGAGEITVSGLPDGAAVHRAFLYWATIGSHGSFTSPTLNGQPVAGTLIGTAEDTCWDAAHNFVYRAEVTAIVAGNGTYTIAGLPASSPTTDDSQGASLVVIYEHSSSPLRTILIDDVAVVMNECGASHTDTLTGFSTGSPLTEAYVTYIFGDGQDGQYYFDGDVLFSGSVIATNVFEGSDGAYWDTLTYDVTSLSPDDPARSTVYNTYPGAYYCDCLLWAATVFVSSSDTFIPTPTPTPSPSPRPTSTPGPTPTPTPTPPCTCIFECESSTAAKSASTSRAGGSARPLVSRVRQAVEMVDLLYRVRDELLRETEAGQHYIDVYYHHSAEIASLMLADPALYDQGMATLELFVPGLEALLEGQGDAVTITADQVAGAEAFLDALSAAGSPELQQAIAGERARRPLGPMAGMTFDEAWAYLNEYALTWSWLPPLSVTAPYTARVGSTIPVQFTLTDPAGDFVADESVTLELRDAGGEVVVRPVGLGGNPARGIVVRGHKYHYNLRTKGLSPGSYTLAASHDSARAVIVLRGK